MVAFWFFITMLLARDVLLTILRVMMLGCLPRPRVIVARLGYTFFRIIWISFSQNALRQLDDIGALVLLT